MIDSSRMRPLLVLWTIAFLGACGPVVYINEVTRTADDRVEQAKAAEADKYSPYYYTRATEYLRKAREVAAYADFQAANAYGRLASEAAEKAIAEAEAVKSKPAKPAPAKDDAPIAPAKETR